jgi:GntR family transcriptional regulator/MocR family aminotransferase
MIHIPIDRDCPVSLARQMAAFLREAILCGTLKPREKLPSTRELSKNLNVARNVAIECYELLAAEGYLFSKPGSGAYVAGERPSRRRRPSTARKRRGKPRAGT